jgi:hypothetical protein
MNLDFHKCAIRSNRAKELLEAKFPGQRRAVGECADYLKEVAQQTGLAFAVQPITTGSILEFSLGDYKFDEKVLSGVKQNIIKKYTAKSTPIKKEEPEKVEAVATPAKEPVAEATQPAQQAVVSELEEFLDLLTWSGVIGAIKLKLVLYGYSMDHGKEGLKQEFEKFTPAGKQKYGKFFRFAK